VLKLVEDQQHRPLRRPVGHRVESRAPIAGNEPGTPGRLSQALGEVGELVAARWELM
jgi:hypothetical protein